MADEPSTTPAAAPAASAADAPRQPDNQPLMGEIPAWQPDPALPAADSELIMSTLFGDKPNSGGDQGNPAKPSDGPAGAAAPSPAPPAQPQAQPSDAQAAQPAGGSVPEQPAFPGAPGSQPQGGAPAPAAQPAAQPAASPAAPAQLPPEVALELHNLRGLVQQLQKQVTQPQPQPQPSPGGTQPQPGNPAAEMEQFRVDLAAPPQIMQALFNADDPVQQQQALNVLLSATATNAVAAAVRHATKLVDDRLTGYSSEQASRAEGERIMREYYEAFPTHNNPLYDQVIQQQWQQLFGAMPGLQWGPDARNALGARVQAALSGLGVQLPLQPQPGQPGGPLVQQQEQPAVTTTPPVLSAQPARPAAFMDSGTRPAQAQGAGNFILETLK